MASIKIGPYSWDVSLNEELAQMALAGRACSAQRLIELNPYNSPMEMYDTWTHEALHALSRVFGFDAHEDSEEDKRDHARIYTFATGLTQMSEDIIDFKKFDRALRQKIQGRRRK